MTEQEKIVKLCEKLNTLLDKSILEGLSHLKQIKEKRLQREKQNELSNKLKSIHQL